MTSRMYTKREYREGRKYILRLLSNEVYIWFPFTKYSFNKFSSLRYNLPNLTKYLIIYISVTSLRNIYHIYLSQYRYLNLSPNNLNIVILTLNASKELKLVEGTSVSNPNQISHLNLSPNNLNVVILILNAFEELKLVGKGMEISKKGYERGVVRVKTSRKG